jgi:nucleoside-diphosphate-sugar epimerase
MKKVLITGASGFIGGHLVEEVLRQGFEVYASIRQNSNKAWLQDPRINFLELDLVDKKGIKRSLLDAKNNYGKFDYIVHNAGITRSKTKNGFDQANYQCTRNLIESLIATDNVPKKFVYISSLAAYGPGNAASMDPINDGDQEHPISLYGISKLKSERYIKSLDNFPYLIFRPTGVYGPREKGYYVVFKTINRHLETFIGTKNQHLTFIYIKDLARLIISSLDTEISCKSYFATDGNYYTTKELFETIREKLDKRTIQIVFPTALVKAASVITESVVSLTGRVPVLNKDKYNELISTNWLCNSKPLYRDFNFTAEFDLKKGVSETVNWYKSNNWL